MNVRQLFSILLLGLALPAAAQFTTIQRAYEVPLMDIRMPQHAAGTLGFKPCSDCDFQTVRVDTDCGWFVDGEPVSFETFQETISSLGDGTGHYLTVAHHLESDVIARVSIILR